MNIHINNALQYFTNSTVYLYFSAFFCNHYNFTYFDKEIRNLFIESKLLCWERQFIKEIISSSAFK